MHMPNAAEIGFRYQSEGMPEDGPYEAFRS